LGEGAAGDATIVRVENRPFDYVDAVGAVLTGDKKLTCAGIVIGGEWWDKGPNL
jgi:dihydroorotase